MISPVEINQIALVFGAIASICLAMSNSVGVLSKSGNAIFYGLDPMEDPEINTKKVIFSHKRKRILAPVGWLLFFLSFALQFWATFI